MTTPAPGPAEDQPGEEEPVFPNVETWFTYFFAEVFRRPLGGSLRWCSQWQLHPEAVIRLTACWMSWESARLGDASAMSAWLRDDMDYHLNVLLDPRGPFYQCSEAGQHIEPRPFPSDLIRLPSPEPTGPAEAA